MRTVRTGLIGRMLLGLLPGSMLLMLALGSSATAQSDAEETVLRVGVNADLTSTNVFGVSAGSDWMVVTSSYDMMLKFAPDDVTAAPSLATGCEPNADYTVWTCTIRDDVLWSDGEPFTAQDIKFSYEFVINNKIPQYKSYFPSNPTFTTPDEHTLVWTSEEPTFAPSVPPWVYIVPEHIWAEHDGKDLKEIKAVDGVGLPVTGPFVLTNHTSGQGFTMERNPNYWGPEPVVDRLDFRVYSNQEGLIQALKNGDVDIVSGLEPSLIASIESEPTITVQRVVSDWWLNLAFNFGGQSDEADPLPALHDLDVRKAIAMSIDKQAIADEVYEGTATTGDTIIRPASAYWHLDIPAEEEYAYDPAAAGALLESAGYVDSDDDGVREDPETGEPMEMFIPASSDTTGAVGAGELIVEYLKAIGISAEMQEATDSKMNDYWGRGNFDAYIWYWSGDPDPNYQLFVFTSEQCGSWSDGCWQDPHFDELYEEQRVTMDQDARLAIVQEAQQYVYEQVPGVVLAYPGWLEAYRNDRFEGWTPSPGAQGYLLPTYNYDTLLTVQPVGETTSSDASSSGLIWLGLGLVIAAVVVVMVVRGRRKMPDEA